MNNYNFKNKLFAILAIYAIFASFDLKTIGKEADLSKAITDAVQAALKARDIGDDSFTYSPPAGLEMDLATNNEISDKTKAARQASMDTFTEFMVVDDRAKFVSLADKVISSVKEWKATEDALSKTTPGKEKEAASLMESSSTIASPTSTSPKPIASTPTSSTTTSSSGNPLLSPSSSTATNPLAPNSTTTPSATSSTSSTSTSANSSPSTDQSNQNPLLASSNPLLPTSSSPTASSSSNPLLPSTTTSTTDSKPEAKKSEETKTPQESKPEEKKPEDKSSGENSGEASDSSTGRSLKKLRDRLKQAKGG